MNIELWNPRKLNKKHYFTCTDGGDSVERFQYEAQVAQQRSWAESLSQPGQNVEVIAFSAVLSGFSPQLQLVPQYSEKFLSWNFSVCNCNTPKGQPRMKKLWIALLPLQLKEWLQGKEVLTEPWCDINLGMSMLSRRQQTRNWTKNALMSNSEQSSSGENDVDFIQ